MGTNGEGVIYTGDDGKLMTAYMGQNPRLFSKAGKMTMPFGPIVKKDEPFHPQRPELGGSASSANAAHFLEWVRACQGGPPARANYAYESPIVETLMLGCIAVRTLHSRLGSRNCLVATAKARSLGDLINTQR
jgi:hypothetical protein